MYENIKKGVVVFIILLFIFGCMSLKTHVNTGLKSPYTESFKIGSENFVFLVKEMHPVFCFDDEDEECGPMISSTASGLVFSSDKNVVYVMTAAHFCASDENFEILFREKIMGFANDLPRELFLLSMDKENDLCMLFGLKENNESFNNIKIAELPKIGETLHTVAAPGGIGGPGKRLIFEGKFAGCDEYFCISTIPATFGSSGAGIYNKKGELVTIVMAVPEDFDHVILSPSRIDLINFVNNIDDIIDIYPYK